MYKYETHLHTCPVSKCATASIKEHLEFYKKMGYDGVFVTNHFLDGSLNIDKTKPYEERINFFYSDYEEGVKLGKELGIKVFCGIETNYLGSDFLIYGLSKEWYLENPQIMDMPKSEQLKFFMENGALVIHAHPFREAGYIDHIRLFPRCVHGVEVINATKTDFENKMAGIYAKEYGLIEFGGTDNHHSQEKEDKHKFAGMESERPIENEQDFVKSVLGGEMKYFVLEI